MQLIVKQLTYRKDKILLRIELNNELKSLLSKGLLKLRKTKWKDFIICLHFWRSFNLPKYLRIEKSCYVSSSLNHRDIIQVAWEYLMDSRINSGNDLEKYWFPSGSEVRATPRVVHYSCISHGRRASMRCTTRSRIISRHAFSLREAESMLQNLKLLRHWHERNTFHKKNLIKFQRSILFVQSALRKSSLFSIYIYIISIYMYIFFIILSFV